MPTEIMTICSSDGAPTELKSMGPIFDYLKLTTALLVASMHEGLQGENSTMQGLTFLAATMHAAIKKVNSEGGIDGQTFTVPPDPSSTEDGGKGKRASYLAAYRWLHMMVALQKTHSAGNALTAVGLGDLAAREEAEAKQQTANAAKHMAEMLKELRDLYHKDVCPTMRCDPKTLASMEADYYKLKQFRPPPPDSPKWGHLNFDREKGRSLVVSNEVLAIDKDEAVEMKSAGQILAQIERMLLAMLLIGMKKVDTSEYPRASDVGYVYRGTSKEYQVHFGIDAFDDLFRRFVMVSAKVRPNDLLAMWVYGVVPRVNSKLNVGFTLGSAVLDMLHSTTMLDSAGARSLRKQHEASDQDEEEESDKQHKKRRGKGAGKPGKKQKAEVQNLRKKNRRLEGELKKLKSKPGGKTKPKGKKGRQDQQSDDDEDEK